MYARLAVARRAGSQHRGLADVLLRQKHSASPALGKGPSKSTRCLQGFQPAHAAIGAQRRSTPFGLHMFPKPAGHHKSAMSSQGPLATNMLSRVSLFPPALPSNSAGVKRKLVCKQGGTDDKGHAHACKKKPHNPKQPAIGGQSSKGRLQIPARLPNLRTTQPAIGDKGPSITQWLEDMLQDKLRTAVWKKGQLFVDLFSGKRSPVGRQVGKRGGAFIAFDVLIDARFDLSHPEVEETLMRWIRQGLVWGLWLGTDCTTWSRASYSKGPGWFNSYRTQRNLWGELTSLSPKAKEKVLQGNAHAQFSFRVLRQIADQPLAVAGLENPAGSVIWLLPELQALGKGSRVYQRTCHYCQYGARWKKPTRFLFVGGTKALAPRKLCTQKGQRRCGKTGLPHLQLGGGRRHPSSGKVLTELATEYPPKLAAQLVDCLAGGSKPA